MVQRPHYCNLREGRGQPHIHHQRIIPRQRRLKANRLCKSAYLHGLFQVHNVHHHSCNWINLQIKLCFSFSTLHAQTHSQTLFLPFQHSTCTDSFPNSLPPIPALCMHSLIPKLSSSHSSTLHAQPHSQTLSLPFRFGCLCVNPFMLMGSLS